jgi:hypothetical protein
MCLNSAVEREYGKQLVNARTKQHVERRKTKGNASEREMYKKGQGSNEKRKKERKKQQLL